MRIAVTLLALSATAAQADWQYTRWGMSPKEVVEASGGAAIVYNDPDAVKFTQKSKLIAPYRSGAFLFRSRFVFEDDKLTIVMLEAQDKTKCPEIHGTLANAYGQPQSYGSGRSLPKWWDRKNGNEVTLIDVFGSCSIQYVPMRQAGAPGGL